MCYEYGKGVEKDLVQAAVLFRQAADQGHAAAQNHLGWCYEKGQGVEKDLVQAAVLYRQAADQGGARCELNPRGSTALYTRLVSALETKM